jgi:hypothetical protein
MPVHLHRKDANLCGADGPAVTTMAAFLTHATPCPDCIDMGLALCLLTIREWCELPATAPRRAF